MNDINGVELVIGDEIIYTNRNLNALRKGVVFAIKKDKVVSKYAEDRPLSYVDGNGKTVAWIAKYHDNIMYGEQVMKL